MTGFAAVGAVGANAASKVPTGVGSAQPQLAPNDPIGFVSTGAAQGNVAKSGSPNAKAATGFDRQPATQQKPHGGHHGGGRRSKSGGSDDDAATKLREAALAAQLLQHQTTQQATKVGAQSVSKVNGAQQAGKVALAQPEHTQQAEAHAAQVASIYAAGRS